ARLLAGGRDYLAGAVLALVLTKPQTGVVLVGAVLVWAARQGRWPILVGFLACLSALCLVSFVVLPDWPWQLLNAVDQTPLVTRDSPWLSVTWWAVLRTLGAPSFILWPAYGAVAGLCLLLVLRKAWDRQATAELVFACAIPTTFMVVPYVRL